MPEGLTRQQLYDKIRESSKEEYILEEMVRLGFWQRDTEKPSVPEVLIKQEGALNKELNQLLQEKYRYRNKQLMLTEMRKARMARAKAKRAETKKRNEEKRIARAAAWAEQKQQDIVYLGENVSAGLNKKVSDEAQLRKFNLPVWHTAQDLANAMQLSLGKLRFLAFNRTVGHQTHYQRFQIPKKSGGTRVISAPMPQLKAAQHWILENVLYKITNSTSANGFVPGKSIVTNAIPHIGKDVVVNIDLKDFFPSIAYKRVKGMFCKLGYSEQVATILGLICTEPDVDEVMLDNRKFFVAKTERRLPQGAPTSPAITNIICFKLDRRFEGLSAKYGYAYTRYADDMTFSAKGEPAAKIGQLLWAAKKIVAEEGFVLHPDKLKVMRKGDRHEVTGIVVNEKLSLDRTTLRKFRALLHQIELTGLANKTWGKGNIISSMEGYANFVAMVKPEQGTKLKNQLNALLQRNDIKAEAQAMWKGEEVASAKPAEHLPEKENKKDNTSNNNKTPDNDKPWWNIL
ncbi:reverse transcriptase family protein [Chitinophaga sp. Cy-1792]|uniref:reverse transcriptase family protein n=1 Tax=Chitinophaga sp. Cy-1792 TaxID=2608339 RepID=UPI001421AD55|nr:reverse transcriptase family protein [Chitinophaga sp. Cy-1792]NIG56296.1 RNA-directed DNA polymerase [Chitinophaga sp. Cy-1792]